MQPDLNAQCAATHGCGMSRENASHVWVMAQLDRTQASGRHARKTSFGMIAVDASNRRRKVFERAHISLGEIFFFFFFFTQRRINSRNWRVRRIKWSSRFFKSPEGIQFAKVICFENVECGLTPLEVCTNTWYIFFKETKLLFHPREMSWVAVTPNWFSLKNWSTFVLRF